LETIENVKLVDVHYPSKTATIVMNGNSTLTQERVEKALKNTKYTVRVFWKK
jgi:hypothetical protein